MGKIFEYSKHIMLWKHMAKEEVIEYIVDKTKYYMDISKDSINYAMYVNISIVEEKKRYIHNVFNEYVANGCYACETDIPCSMCPIKIGTCFSSGMYRKYIHAIANYTETNNKEYLNEAIQYALDIAHAELNTEAIEHYNIEVC